MTPWSVLNIKHEDSSKLWHNNDKKMTRNKNTSPNLATWPETMTNTYTVSATWLLETDVSTVLVSSVY